MATSEGTKGELERLIEMGLAEYGAGRLDAALAAWQAAQALAPTDARIARYVDYLRDHYVLLATSPHNVAEGHAAADHYELSDDDAYLDYDLDLAETRTGDARARASTLMDEIDEGWDLDDEIMPAPQMAVAVAAQVAAARTRTGNIELPPFTQVRPDVMRDAAHPAPARASTIFGIGERARSPSRPPPAVISVPPLATATGEGEPSRRRSTTIDRAIASAQVQIPQTLSDLVGPAPVDPDDDDEPEIEATVETRAVPDVDPTIETRAVAPRPSGPDGRSADDDDDDEATIEVTHFTTAAPEADDFESMEVEYTAAPAPEPPAVEEAAPLRGGRVPTGDQGDESATAEFEAVRPRRTSLAPPSGAALPVSPHALSDRPVTDEFGFGAAGRPEQTTGQRRGALGFVRLAGADLPPDATAPDLALAPPAPSPSPSTHPAPPRGLGPATAAMLAAFDDLADADDLDSAATIDPGIPGVPASAHDELGPALGEVMAAPGSSDSAGAPDPDDVAISQPTQDLGLARNVAARVASMDDLGMPVVTLPRAAVDPLTAARAALSGEVDVGARPDETADERLKRRIKALLELSVVAAGRDDLGRAVLAIDLALGEAPDSAAAQKLIYRARDQILGAFERYVGDLRRCPTLVVPLQQLGAELIDSRAAFLLSRVDGVMTFEEILDVSGMPRLEAFRYLVAAVMRGVLRVVD